MNWPELSPECSKAIAEVLEDVVAKRPGDPVQHMSRMLAERSGLDPAAFEEHFHACRREPRTYALEDVCPAGTDPISWVRMRYNDDTIRLLLGQSVFGLVSDMLSRDSVTDMVDLIHRVCAAYPEVQYLRGTPEEAVAFQTVRAVFLGCTGAGDVLDPASLDDADPALAFRCSDLLDAARTSMIGPAVQNEAMPDVPSSEAALDALLVCCLLRVIGTSATFQARLGGGLAQPEQAALHAISNESEALPSFHRLSLAQKSLVVAVLKAHFPLDAVACSEAVPAHFMRSKELVGPIEGALRFALAVAAVERLVESRAVSKARGLEFLRLGGQCLTALEKYAAPRAYEMYLKKRAERHAWRLVKDDFRTRCIIRICILARLEDTAEWTKMNAIFDGLPKKVQQILESEVGRKDGVNEMQTYVMFGASALLEQAWANAAVGAGPALTLMSRILQDAARACVRLANQQMVPLHMECLGAHTRQYRTNGVPFEDTPFTLEEGLPNEMILKMVG